MTLQHCKPLYGRVIKPLQTRRLLCCATLQANCFELWHSRKEEAASSQSCIQKFAEEFKWPLLGKPWVGDKQLAGPSTCIFISIGEGVHRHIIASLWDVDGTVNVKTCPPSKTRTGIALHSDKDAFYSSTDKPLEETSAERGSSTWVFLRHNTLSAPCTSLTDERLTDAICYGSMLQTHSVNSTEGQTKHQVV